MRLTSDAAEERAVHSLLLIGGPAAGKTVYGTQLLGRMEVNHGALRLRGAIPTILPFREAFERLASGFAPEHTGVSVYHELRLPVLTPGNAPVDLVWPDYGGEQVRALVEQRLVTSEWGGRIQTAAGWILMIRLDQLRMPGDLLTRPAELVTSFAEAESPPEPSRSAFRRRSSTRSKSPGPPERY